VEQVIVGVIRPVEIALAGRTMIVGRKECVQRPEFSHYLAFPTTVLWENILEPLDAFFVQQFIVLLQGYFDRRITSDE